jgi:hypothetical protein
MLNIAPGEPLARRAGPHRVESRQVHGERVLLVELERVSGLRFKVKAHNLETSAVKAHRSAPGSTEEVGYP